MEVGLFVRALGTPPGRELEHEEHVAQNQDELKAHGRPAPAEALHDLASKDEVDDQQPHDKKVANERHRLGPMLAGWPVWFKMARTRCRATLASLWLVTSSPSTRAPPARAPCSSTRRGRPSPRSSAR